MIKQVTIWYLDIPKQAEGIVTRVDETPSFELTKASIPCPELNRFLYTAVGGRWYWVDRLNWSHKKWFAYLNRDELQTWVAYVSGVPVGYFELEKQQEDDVEVAYFGLLPQFIGRGFGSALLSLAVQQAWAMGASRVWTHTCSLDHPHALPNYLARGFKVYKEITESKTLPTLSPGPWPGAYADDESEA